MVVWFVRITVLILLTGVGWLYGRGWRSLRRAGSTLGHLIRLCLLCGSALLVLLALFPPLYNVSHELLYVRALQKIMVAMLAAPLFWLACPAHILLRGAPFAWRHSIVHALRADTRSGQLVRLLTSTGVAWMLYVAAIVIWHDPHIVAWTMNGSNLHYLTLAFMFGAALLYWVHIVGTGWHLRRALPGWVIFAYAVGVEIPNMTAGITIAYSSVPLYEHYADIARRIGMDMIEMQIWAGGLVWFGGSVVFFFSAVMIINRIFLRHGSSAPEYFPDWDSDDRMIAPGLEHRLREDR